MYVLTNIEKNHRILLDSIQSKHETAIKALNELQTFNQYDIVIQMTYIFGGIILTHMAFGVLSIFRTLLARNPISITHFIYGLMGPVIMCHFIFYTAADIDISDTLLKSSNAFYFGFSIFILNCMLLAISLELYPYANFQDTNNYSLENPVYRQYLIEHRRKFYSLLFLYSFSMFLWAQEFCAISEPPYINKCRIILTIVLFILITIQFKKNDNTISFNIPGINLNIKNYNQLSFGFSNGVSIAIYKFDNLISYELFYRIFELVATAILVGMTLVIMYNIALTY